MLWKNGDKIHIFKLSAARKLSSGSFLELSDFSHFRKRIGRKGMERIFPISVEIHGNQALESEIVVDTTVQEKNVTFPTDTKLIAKVIVKCWRIAKRENLVPRRRLSQGSEEAFTRYLVHS